MPVQYTGIIEEHRAVRENMGMFDLSHMGEFRVSGQEALGAIDYLVTNDIRGLDVHQVRYTPMCYGDGGIVDDLLVYRFPDHLMLVVNASNIDKDMDWIRQHVPSGVHVENISDDVALIAVQGPRAEEFLRPLTEVDLEGVAYYHSVTGRVAGVDAIISRTGYTGEDGFELYVASDAAPELWSELRSRGEPDGLKLVGLGARDTLRLEAGYMLYGNDIDETTSPLEAGLGWTVKFLDGDFVARDVLEQQKAEGVKRRMVAVEMDGRGVPRPHFPLWIGDQPLGELTSGTFSPTFNKGIGLGYIQREGAKPGTEVQVEIRDRRYPARVARKPLYKRRSATGEPAGGARGRNPAGEDTRSVSDKERT